MQREKLITLENNVSSDLDKGNNDTIYYVGLNVDGKRQQEKLDTKKMQSKSKFDTGHMQRRQNTSEHLRNSEKKRIKKEGGGAVEENPKERQNRKNTRSKKQQEVTTDEEKLEGEKKIKQEIEQVNVQLKKTNKKWKKETDSSSESSSLSDEGPAVDLLTEDELEKLMEAIDEKKKLIASLKTKPWSMNKKLSVLRRSQAFIEMFENIVGQASKNRFYAYKIIVMKKWAKFQRHFNNIKAACVPWRKKIKEIESHFGSSIAAYFIFMRWLFVMNIILTVLSFGLVMFPEAIMGEPYGSIPRKTVPRDEQSTAMNFEILYDTEGYLKYSLLFYGYYNDKRTIGWLKYRMPFCYFVVGLASIAYSYIEVIKAIAHNASNACVGDDTIFKYSWIIFTSWDYLVGDSEAADNKFVANVTALKEVIVDEKQLRKKVNVHWKRFVRVMCNILVFIILIGSGYIIYYIVRRSTRFITVGMEKFSWWERNEVNIVMSMITTFGPMMFEAIALLEDYHPRTTLRWQMARVFALYVGNLYSFLIGIIDQVNVARNKEEEMKTNLTIWEINMYNKSIAENLTGPFRMDPADVPRGPCWETIVGQEFVRMVITDTLAFFIVLLVNDFIRAVLVRYLNNWWCWDLEYSFPCYSEFDLSGNLLTLIFNQGMIAMGSFYAPCLPTLNLIRLEITMYIHCWAIMCCNIPPIRIYKASRSSNFYMNMLLVVLFISTLPIIFTIVALRPSFDCGPFSGKNHMYDVLYETLQMDFPVWLVNAISYITNPALLLTLILCLGLMIYYLQTTSKAFKQANVGLRKKLQNEYKEQRRKSRIVAKTKAKNMAANIQQDKQMNNNAPVKSKGSNRSIRETSYHPPNINTRIRSSSLQYSHAVPCTRPPAPRSYLTHGQLPGIPPH